MDYCDYEEQMQDYYKTEPVCVFNFSIIIWYHASAVVSKVNCVCCSVSYYRNVLSSDFGIDLRWPTDHVYSFWAKFGQNYDHWNKN